MDNIHSTAIISKNAQIASNAVIGPYCNIGPNVSIGDNCILMSNVIIDGDTEVGIGCKFFPFSVIGMIPQDLKYNGENTKLKIGTNNIFREHSTVHIGTDGGGGITKIGNNNLIMSGVHIAHDCKLGNNIVLSHHVALAGHVEIDDFSILSAMVGVVQFRRIGKYSMIGGLCAVDTDILPFSMATSSGGSRAYLEGVNIIGMKRRGFANKDINEVKSIFNNLFDKKLPIVDKILQFKKEKNDNIIFKEIRSFLEKDSKVGICQPKVVK